MLGGVPRLECELIAQQIEEARTTQMRGGEQRSQAIRWRNIFDKNGLLGR